MLRRLLGNIVPTIDRLIERIPPHIRDIIQKASIAFAALIALLVIISGINKGLREAQPMGYKLIERNRDLFYLQEMREEYAKKRQLVEDVEVDPLQFPSRQKATDETRFATMGRDTMGHLMGEKDEMLKSEDPLRPKEKSPGYLGDSYTIPRLTPDKKTIEDEEGLLSKEKIGSVSKAAAQPESAATAKKEETSANKPAAQRDIFDSPEDKLSPTPARRPSVSENTPPIQTTPKKNGKLEFME